MGRSRGFTIVELLIVVTIIALLASLVVASVANSQARARDAKRKTDIKAIAKALDMHYADKSSYTLPENMCTDSSIGGQGGCGDSPGEGEWDPNSDLRDMVTENRLKELPKDPLNNAEFYYTYEPHARGVNGFDGYDLCAVKLETESGNYCVRRRS